MNKEIIIVDTEDNVIGLTMRGEPLNGKLFRVSALWLMDIKGNILLSKRSVSKKHHPGKWGPAIEGTNERGDTYESNIIRKAYQELGITLTVVKKLQKVIVTGKYPHIHQWFLAIIDGDTELICNHDEVSEIQWLSKKELQHQIQATPDDFLVTLDDVNMLSPE